MATMEESQPQRSNAVGYWVASALVLLGAALLAGLLQKSVLSHVHVPVRAWQLPLDAAESLSRMILAYIVSLLFALSVGIYAARNRKAERIILPVLDILQSIPIVSFFPAALAVAAAVFGGGRLGMEFSAIVLIFTGMAWNMTFSVYESLRMMPPQTIEAAESFGIRGSQRFFAITLPVCIPGLLYNSIVSWAAGWFALTACEILTVGNQNVTLPGLGSFLGQAVNSQHPILYNCMGAGTLMLVVLMLEFFVWRPLVVWAERFKYEMSVSTLSRDHRGILGWYQKGRVPRLAMDYIVHPLNQATSRFLRRLHGTASGITLPRVEAVRPVVQLWEGSQRVIGWLTIAVLVLGGGFYSWHVIAGGVSPLAKLIPLAIGESYLRILLAYLLSLAWVIPTVLWARTRPRAFRALSSISQSLASMPPIALLFIVVSVFVRHMNLGPRWGVELACLFLLMNGVQWYVLYNMLGGISRIPGDLIEATDAMGLPRMMKWKKLILPAILPSLFTGTITAFGGGWNTLIFSESISYANHYYNVTGIGWLLDVASAGRNPPIASGTPLPKGDSGSLLLLGVASLILLIVILNRFLWKRLQAWAVDRFRLDY